MRPLIRPFPAYGGPHPAHLGDEFLGQYVTGDAAGHHAPLAQHDDPVAVPGGEAEVVQGDDGGDREPVTRVSRSNWWRMSGWLVGSSRRSSRGSWASARAICTRRRSPPDRVCQGWSARSVSPARTARSSSAEAGGEARRCGTRPQAYDIQDRQLDLRVGLLPDHGESAGDLTARQPGGGRTVEGDDPAVGASRPVNSRRSVDFPEPLGPNRPTVEPCSGARVTPSRIRRPSARRLTRSVRELGFVRHGASSWTSYDIRWPRPRPSASPLRVSSGFAPDSLTTSMSSTGLGKPAR